MAGVKFWCYTAGHVLGAAMFMIEIAGVKVMVLNYYMLCVSFIPWFACLYKDINHSK